MKFSETPTISAARDAGTRAQEQRAARDVMNAMLFREILKPFAQGLGPMGEIVTGQVADAMFVRPRR